VKKNNVEIGMRFGHLKVISQKETGEKRTSWLCECDCGNKIVRGTTRLLGTENRRPDRSCGCKRHARNGNTLKHPRIYKIWTGIIDRCYNENRENYDRYGAKGIRVCEEWLNNFDSFLKWALENGYSDELNINRIDPTKNYEPSNCRWSNTFVQMQNRGMLKNNKTGVTGVAYIESQGFYRTYITRDNIRKDLGKFSTLEGAKKARIVAEEYYKKYGTLKGL